MANLPINDQFGKPEERMQTAVILKALGVTKYRLAKIAGVDRSTVGRWRKYIPKEHHSAIRLALFERTQKTASK